MDVEAWEAWEAAWPHEQAMAEQARVDRVRVLGYALYCAREVVAAKDAMEKAVDALTRAQARAEKARERLERVLEHAEQAAECATAADKGWTSEVAQCLEELLG